MATMLGNIYAALVEAGASEEKAQKAAEELANYDSRFSRIEGELLLLKWMSGTTLALVVAVLLKLFVH
jgi:hypothetical protein